MSATTPRHTTTEVTVLRVRTQEINTDTISDELRDEFLDAHDRAGGHVVIDMSGVHYVNSTGIRAFVSINKKAHERGGRVVLAGLSEFVTTTFRAVKVLTEKGATTSTIEHHPDVPAAVAALYRSS